MSMQITGFTWKPVGTYPATGGIPNSGTTIDMHFKATVLKPIIMRRQVETVDGKAVMDSSYPAEQPITPIGEYISDNKNYMHIPFRLSFSPLGHIYTVSFEYHDIETGSNLSVTASAHAFQSNEAILDGVVAVTAVSMVGYLILKRRRK